MPYLNVAGRIKRGALRRPRAAEAVKVEEISYIARLEIINVLGTIRLVDVEEAIWPNVDRLVGATRDGGQEDGRLGAKEQISEAYCERGVSSSDMLALD
jgi:hypothetical protein